MFRLAILVALTVWPGCVLAQHSMGSSHAAHAPGAESAATEGGQSAFAAIQEIVAILMADPHTDWTRVDIEALRRHLIDMDNVTLRSRVDAVQIDAGVLFEVASDDPDVTASIRRMVPAHIASASGIEGWTMTSEEIPGGAALSVTGADPDRIGALGFLGVMTLGMHHQTHHLALASGQNPHAH